MNRKYLKETSKQQIKGKIGTVFLMNFIMFAVSFAVSFVLSFILGLIGGIILAATKPDPDNIKMISFVISSVCSGISSMTASVICVSAFSLGMVNVYLTIADNNTIKVSDVFSGFKDFWAAFKVVFLVGLFTFLWSLLFIVPGIIKSYSYSMSLYILSEDKSKSALQCIRESKEITNGHKMDLFVLRLSFLGWIILGVITCGIANIYVTPYMCTTYANAYKSLKKPDFETQVTY